MNKADWYYFKSLSNILNYGVWDENPRPKWEDGTPAHSKFITQIFEEYDISNDEFPITTVRQTAVKTGIKEILWIYQDQTNSLDIARARGINWWEPWNVGDNTIGERYGQTVKNYDLMNKLLHGLEKDPYGRRHIMDLWQLWDLVSGPGLMPCAFQTMWSVRGEYLDMTLTQRSNDYIVAGYINKIQYVALQMMVAEHVGLKPGRFCHLTQNLHIYDRHIEVAKTLHDRLMDKANSSDKTIPSIILNMEKLGRGSFYDYSVDHFELIGSGNINKLDVKLEIAQ